MRPRLLLLLAVVMVTPLVSPWVECTTAAPQGRDMIALMAQVAQRVAAYYQRAQQLICIEESTVIPIAKDWSMTGLGRTVQSELRVDWTDTDGPADPQITREIRRINGRAPRERDRRDRSGCTDPTPFSTEPLAFLLPAHRDEYRFTGVRDARERDRTALLIDFVSAERSSHAGLIEDERGHDDCFDWKGSIAIDGRVWIDAVTYDVLRVERHIVGPIDVRVPSPLQRKYLFPAWLTLERDDMTLRFKDVAFTDPEEIVLLPESMESMTMFRTGLQSIRTRQVFSDYRRFLTGSRIVRSGGSTP